MKTRLRCNSENHPTKLIMDSVEKILTLYQPFLTTDMQKLNGYRRLDPKLVAVHMTIRVDRRLIAQLRAQLGAKIIRCITIRMRI